MKKRCRSLILALGIGLGIGVFVSCGNIEYFELVERCKKIQPGMTEEEVLAKLGKPAQTRTVELNGRLLRTLGYPAPSLTAAPPYIGVDRASRRVVRVFCDDSHEVVDTTDPIDNPALR